MADAIVEPRPTARFFCHRCSIEFEDVLQDYTCPYCAGGFIEQLESSSEGMGLSGDDFSDADMSNFEDISNLDDMSNLDDLEDHPFTPPMLNDLAFLMSGRRLRGNGNQQNTTNTTAPNAPNAPRRNTLMEELVWMIGGARPGTGAVTAGAPFVFVGAPGDYVFGGEGLDAVVTQLLGQLENAGPPPLPRERLAALPDEPVSEEQAAANTACSVCWDNFSLGETVCRLECEHIFHSACIRPWLQLHATCPICRRSLLPPGAPADVTATTATTATTAATAATTPPTTATPATNPTDSPTATIRTSIAAALPRILLRRIVHHPALRGGRAPAWSPASGSRAPGDSASSTSASSAASAASTPSAPSAPSATSAPSAPSASAASILSDIERHYNMDLDMD